MNHRAAPTAVRCRAGAVWGATSLTASAALLGAAHATSAALRPRTGSPDFTDLVVAGCAAACAAAALALWALATQACARAALRPAATAHAVGPVRRALLLACGVAVLATGSRAHAGDAGEAPAVPGATPPTLAGLTLPDRTVTRPHAMSGTVVVVRAGDSLWSIAAATAPTPGGTPPSAQEVAARSHRLHRANRAVIGADPDLIHPGQRLTLPGPTPHRRNR